MYYYLMSINKKTITFINLIYLLFSAFLRSSRWWCSQLKKSNLFKNIFLVVFKKKKNSFKKFSSFVIVRTLTLSPKLIIKKKSFNILVDVMLEFKKYLKSTKKIKINPDF